MRAIVLVLLVMFSLNGFAQATNKGTPDNSGAYVAAAKPSADPVKKSKTGICHAPGSTYYSRTTHFTPFKTLDECLASGGRMPKR